MRAGLHGQSAPGPEPGSATHPLRPPRPVAPERAAAYVESGYWNDHLLRDGVEMAASERPDAVAVADNHVSLTWAQFAARIASGVGRVRSLGVGPGQAVLLIAGNTVEGVVAYHSLTRSGVIAVVLDRRSGATDVRLAIEAVGVSGVIAPREAAERFAVELRDVPAKELEDFSLEAPLDSEGITWEEPDRDAVAVVLFTSGTTSRPKGVTHSLNTLAAAARNMAYHSSADVDTVLYLVSPLVSITGIMQICTTADQHCALVLEDHFEPDATLDRINRWRATDLGGAPVIAERLLQVADRRPDRRIALRRLALGGAMLPRPLLERATDEYGIEIVRVYGSSEAPNAAGSAKTDDRDRRLADDGVLTPGLEVRVGSARHPQEGLLRGPGVFLGYIDEGQNRDSFEDTWYRTGDLIELTGDRVTVVGRLQEIVNRNGLKISLAEAETELRDYPTFEEYATFGMSDQETGERLAVAVVPRQGSDVTLEDVVSYLRSAGVSTRKLPEQLVIWDGPLPRTHSGKVIRSRLAMDAPAKRSMVADRLRVQQPPPEEGSDADDDV